MQLGKELIEKLYATFSELPLEKVPNFSIVQKKIFQNLSGKVWLEIEDDCGFYYEIMFPWQDKKNDILLPLCSGVDDFLHCSVKKFVKTFREATMTIFEALLLEKRVLFLGGKNTSAHQLCRFVCAAANLISPPMYGILHRVFPYCSWNNLDFLSVKGYIAGVSARMFRPRTNWYDICCDIENGVVICSKSDEYKSQRYFKDDLDFIEYLLVKIAERHLSEEEIRFSFGEYTQHLLDLALGEEEVIQDGARGILETQWARVFALKRTRTFMNQRQLCEQHKLQIKNGVSFRKVQLHIRNLIHKSSLSNENMFSLLNDIFLYMETEEQISEVLSLLPKYNEGIHLIGKCLFSSEERIVKICVDILKKIQELRVGQYIFTNSNLIIQHYYYKIAAMIQAKHGGSFIGQLSSL